MRAVELTAPRVFQLAERAIPECPSGYALVRVEAVGVCGSDLHYYEEGRIGETRIVRPLVLGHEFAGRVERVGEEASEDLVGKRVAVEPGVSCGRCEWCLRGDYNLCPRIEFPGGPPHDGALREFIAVPAASCFPVPEGFGADEAAAMEPLSVATFTVDLAHIHAGDTVAIFGLGPIGILTGWCARIAGAERILGADLHSYRCEAAKGLGAVDEAFDGVDPLRAIVDATKGRGVDAAIDAARSPDTAGHACLAARPGGQVVLTGISGNEHDPIPVSAARRKGLTMRWCRRFQHCYPRAIAMTDSGRINLRPMLTHHFTLDETARAFEMVSNAADGVLKATIMV